MRALVVAACIGMLAFASAVELVLSRHTARQLFVELQDLRGVEQDLEQEWGQLLLEQATWGAEQRVEQLASSKLDMLVPTPDGVLELQ